LARQFVWNVWLHMVVMRPLMLVSSLSRQTGQAGSSVWPGGGGRRQARRGKWECGEAGSPSLRTGVRWTPRHADGCPHLLLYSTLRTKSRWQTLSGSSEVNGLPW